MDTQIFFTLVAFGKDKILLSETLPGISGNYQQMMARALPKFPKQNTNFLYHYPNSSKPRFTVCGLVMDDVSYVCMAGKSVRVRVMRKLLAELSDTFMERCSEQYRTAIAYELKKKFDREKPTLLQMLCHCNTQDFDRATQAKRKARMVSASLHGNLEKLLMRGEQIEVMLHRVENLKAETISFRGETTHLKQRQQCSFTQKMICVAIIVVLAIAAVVAAVVLVPVFRKKFN